MKALIALLWEEGVGTVMGSEGVRRENSLDIRILCIYCQPHAQMLYVRHLANLISPVLDQAEVGFVVRDD